VATITDFGSHPCPQCLITINEIHAMGRDDDRKRHEELRHYDDAERRKKVDEAREWVYDRGYAITGDKVKDLLKDQLMVPTKVFASTFTCMQASTPFSQNTFSLLLSPFGFDFHKMLTVDLLHKVELGVWKSLLTHLIRMLHVCGRAKSVNLMNIVKALGHGNNCFGERFTVLYPSHLS